MKKNSITSYYLLEATYKTSENSKITINEISEEFRDDNLLQARRAAFNRFNELVYKILDGNSIRYESSPDAYSKLLCNFLNPIILEQQPTPKRLLAFISQKQFITLSFILECKVNVGEPKREIFSTNKYTIYGISTSLSITDYLDALLREKGLYNYVGYDAENTICKKKIQLDSEKEVEVNILEVDVERILSLNIG